MLYQISSHPPPPTGVPSLGTADMLSVCGAACAGALWAVLRSYVGLGAGNDETEERGSTIPSRTIGKDSYVDIDVDVPE